MANKITSLTVHLLTASGAVIGLWSLILMAEGDAANSLRFLALAAASDSVDGTLARMVDVSKHMPQTDGALIDNLVDYLTWVFLPVVWGYLFMGIPFAICSVVLLVSLFGFSHKQAKTEDHFFRGFPSYWNLLIFYLYIFDAGVWVSSIILIIFSIFVLIPVRFVYPSRTLKLRKTTLSLSVPYIAMIIAMLLYMEETPLWFSLASLYFPCYYTGLSFYLTRSRS